MSETVDSTSDARTVNNVMRHEYRVLSDEEKAAMKWFKDTGAAFPRIATNAARRGRCPSRRPRWKRPSCGP